MGVSLSPRAWGWSAGRQRLYAQRRHLPTSVGMVQTSPSGPRSKVALPPRAWGWSVQDGGLGSVGSPFPTGVGMVRCRSRTHSRRIASPHGRGDGPGRETMRRIREHLSPRAWGWSVPFVLDVYEDCSFPTSVGMVRGFLFRRFQTKTFPHGRGDNPNATYGDRYVAAFSSQVWG